MSHLAGIYAKTPLNQSDIPQSHLDIANKSRSNPLRWNGQFSPQLIQVLLKTYAQPDSVLFDPFLGSGTLLLEAGLAGLSASGTEINPAAVTLARTYHLMNIPLEHRRKHLTHTSTLLQQHFLPVLPLFHSHADLQTGVNPDAIKSTLLSLVTQVEHEPEQQLIKTLIVLVDFSSANLSAGKVLKVWSKLTKMVRELPYSEQPIDIFHTDARRVPCPPSSVDLVITSPPYINVFNYHQQYRKSMECLNWNVLRVAKSEIGSNRKHRGNRFLTVIQFCLDIAQTFHELARVCRANGRLIFVVGRESKVRGTAFFNSEIVAEIAHRALGFDLILRQERAFKNRFGKRIVEDILHFSPPSNHYVPADYLDIVKSIAQDVLQRAYLGTAAKSKAGITAAIEQISCIQPSPLFELPSAYVQERALK